PRVAVDGVEEVLEAAIHNRMDVFGIEPGGQGGEPNAVDEQDGHLLPLALERGSRSEDLLGKMPGRVAASLLGQALGDRRGARVRGHGRPCRRTVPAGKGLTALVAELGAGAHDHPASRALAGESSATVVAELGARPILVLALSTGHSAIIAFILLTVTPQRPARRCGPRACPRTLLRGPCG